ncbi:MAG: hypothetical protein RID11_13800, partial [Roseovarius sp.]|uniref:hypothetical protein n=1 Tax=Roseovarius sp. TaxID=1486281 RepID=UPI0032ED75FC
GAKDEGRAVDQMKMTAFSESGAHVAPPHLTLPGLFATKPPKVPAASWQRALRHSLAALCPNSRQSFSN